MCDFFSSLKRIDINGVAKLDDSTGLAKLKVTLNEGGISKHRWIKSFWAHTAKGSVIDSIDKK